MKITLQNYRCFGDEPVSFEIKPGFTAFIGPNNAGKTALVRLFYELRDVFAILANAGNIQNLSANGSVGINPRVSGDSSQVFFDKNDRPLKIALEDDKGQRIAAEITRHCSLQKASVRLPNYDPAGFDNVGVVVSGDNLVIRHHAGELVLEYDSFKSWCNDVADSLYFGAFRNVINVGTNSDYYGVHLGQSFIRQWHELKTGPSKAASETCQRITRDIQHLFGFDDLQINASLDAMTIQLYINEKSYKINEVGAGLSQFILTLATAAIRNPAYILLDEPELNLHPQLQIDFITTLTKYARRGLLFATHSYGLARSSAESVFVVRPGTNGNTVSRLEAHTRLAVLLGELSYGGYSALGFEKVLLVEGAHDVKAIQQVLRLMQKDHRIVLLPLGGSSMINAKRDAELGEITRICPEVYALIDSEIGSAEAKLEPPRRDFVRSCNDVGIKCKVLDRRAIENYFTDRAVKEVFPSCRGLNEFEDSKGADGFWGKPHNWRVAFAMQRSEWSGTDLWTFLEAL